MMRRGFVPAQTLIKAINHALADAASLGTLFLSHLRRCGSSSSAQ